MQQSNAVATEDGSRTSRYHVPQGSEDTGRIGNSTGELYSPAPIALAPRSEHHGLTQFRILLTRDKDEVILWIGCWNAKNIAVYFSMDGRGFVSPNNVDRAFDKLRKMNHLRLNGCWRYIMTAEQSKQELSDPWAPRGCSQAFHLRRISIWQKASIISHRTMLWDIPLACDGGQSG